MQGFTANGATIDVDTLISSLFFTYEANVYGLLTNRTDYTIEVSTAELLDIFQQASSTLSSIGLVQMKKVWNG